MAEKIFAKGIVTFAPRAGAPDFVKGSIIITLEDFKEWVNGEGRQYLTDYNGKKQLRFNLTDGKENRPCMAVDTWKKEAAPEPPAPEGDANGDSLPF